MNGNARLWSEIVEAVRDLNKHGLVSLTDLEKTTQMLGRDALPMPGCARVSQAVTAFAPALF